MELTDERQSEGWQMLLRMHWRPIKGMQTLDGIALCWRAGWRAGWLLGCVGLALQTSTA